MQPYCVCVWFVLPAAKMLVLREVSRHRKTELANRRTPVHQEWPLNTQQVPSAGHAHVQKRLLGLCERVQFLTQP